jgi:hypothetical protein
MMTKIIIIIIIIIIVIIIVIIIIIIIIIMMSSLHVNKHELNWIIILSFWILVTNVYSYEDVFHLLNTNFLKGSNKL